jgi:hypothetical protein
MGLVTVVRAVVPRYLARESTTDFNAAAACLHTTIFLMDAVTTARRSPSGQQLHETIKPRATYCFQETLLPPIESDIFQSLSGLRVFLLGVGVEV